MKKTKVISSLCSLLLFITACGGGANTKDYSKEVDEGTFQGNNFTSEALGWTMSFPDNWIITKKSSLESLDKRSKAISEDSTVNMSGIKRTLAFQKNFNNNFQSTWEEFEGDENDYKRILYSMREMIYENYLDQRTTMDTTAGTEVIGGITFDRFQLALYDRTNKNFANQLLYTALVNGKFMTVTIAYDNEADKEKIVGLFRASKFK